MYHYVTKKPRKYGAFVSGWALHPSCDYYLGIFLGLKYVIEISHVFNITYIKNWRIYRSA
jgi:hypothetical protein